MAKVPTPKLEEAITFARSKEAARRSNMDLNGRVVQQVVTVSDQGQSPREDTGGNHQVTFDAINHGEGQGRIRQDMSATFVEKMDVSLEMTMEDVQHSDNSAGSAEAEIISKERLLARRDGSRGEEKETKVEQELAELFKYAVYQEQGRRPWQRSMSKHWMGRIRLGL